MGLLDGIFATGVPTEMHCDVRRITSVFYSSSLHSQERNHSGPYHIEVIVANRKFASSILRQIAIDSRQMFQARGWNFPSYNLSVLNLWSRKFTHIGEDLIGCYLHFATLDNWHERFVDCCPASILLSDNHSVQTELQTAFNNRQAAADRAAQLAIAEREEIRRMRSETDNQLAVMSAAIAPVSVENVVAELAQLLPPPPQLPPFTASRTRRKFRG